MFRYGQHAHHPLVGILLLILFGALVVLAVLAVIHLWRGRPSSAGAVTPTSGPGGAHDPALTELRLRYARGEVAPDEYVQRVAGLGYQLPPGSWSGGPSAAPPAPPPTA
jgi:uncharacterized membrane protein